MNLVSGRDLGDECHVADCSDVLCPPKPSPTVLETAGELVEGHRGRDYGHPWEDFNRTAALWNALFAHKLKVPFTASDVAAGMRMVKESRLQHSPRHRDSLVDICGYARTQELVWEREEPQ